MLLIYVNQKTNRLNYIFDFFFREALKTRYQITTDKEAFLASDQPKLSYGNQPLGEELFFYATPLLFERGIQEQKITTFAFQNTIGFFATSDASALPFDPFAAAFYLITRYEEYLPFRADQFGRYPANSSIAYQNNFLHQPVVDHWVQAIKRKIKEKYPSYPFVKRKYQFLPSYDIDAAFAYKHKGVLRTAGGFLQSLIKGDWATLKGRTKCVLGLAPDPYLTFNWLYQLHKKYNLSPVYFFLVGDYGEYDRNISISTKAFQSLIKSVGDYAEVGIHPSYASNNNVDQLKTEIKRLHEVVKRDITKSRQHFLKLNLPTTYQHLLEAEIQADYTMGYAAEPGFRAGTCTPFYFYDLDFETSTSLRIYPFTLMDATLRQYLKLTPEQASQRIHKLIDEVKQVNGTFISLWHNSSLSEIHGWQGWRKVYIDLVNYANPSPMP